MKREGNGMAVAGFILSVCAVPLFAAGLLCLLGVMFSTLVGLVFGGMAGVTAVIAIIFSSMGNYKSYEHGVRGAALSLTGLLVGTVVLTLVLAALTLLIVAAFAV